MNKTRIAILGYGNLGKGAEAAIAQNEDLELVCVFTRRDPASVTLRTPGVPVYSVEKAPELKDAVDVLLLCGGSATDLPWQTPKYAALFNVVDSYDTHARIPEHFARVEEAAKAAGKTALISCGWDPGMFSLARLYANCVLPQGKDETFWGRGVSQGHSDAIRRIEGVLDARQYTVPIQDAVDRVRRGEQPVLTARAQAASTEPVNSGLESSCSRYSMVCLCSPFQPVTPPRRTEPPWGRAEWSRAISSAVIKVTVVSYSSK